MIHLIVAFVLVTILSLINRKLSGFPDWKQLTSMILFGVSIGLTLDYVIGYKIGLWSYTHHQYWFPDYFLFLIPAWGMVISLFILFYSLLERIVKNDILRLGIYFSIIPLQQEFMGAWQQSWSYYAPLGLMIFGWVVLLFICIQFKNFLVWLSENKVEIKYYSRQEVLN